MSLTFLVKLSVSLFVGLMIGLDRQLKNKPLGVKTSMVISVASCLITIVSIQSVHKYSLPGHTNMDPMRLAAQIVSGVGFLGAGVILRRNNDVISGLTTASMVWAASALGIAIGAGFYAEALVAMVFVILAINVFPYLVKRLGPAALKQQDLAVKMIVGDHTELNAIFKEIKQLRMQVKRVKVKDLDADRQQVEMIVLAPEKLYTTDLYSSLKRIQHVLSVEVESR
ncbi:MgtC/SapB family protein [Ectobacillus ponti]|uniref:MgtC/SapB family protein n=1 Tax=Ectobacillus ponti TaxID=2961894 RepID=A0AA41X5U8_9BACI|nr:MgtC/SapB family protein [Ectobacillus ponti]MCP8967728.1 MgtC/SapB family protein [Ectobacillus ponti]